MFDGRVSAQTQETEESEISRLRRHLGWTEEMMEKNQLNETADGTSELSSEQISILKEKFAWGNLPLQAEDDKRIFDLLIKSTREGNSSFTAAADIKEVCDFYEGQKALTIKFDKIFVALQRS